MLYLPAHTEIFCPHCKAHVATTKEAIKLTEPIRLYKFEDGEGQFDRQKSSKCLKCETYWIPAIMFQALKIA